MREIRDTMPSPGALVGCAERLEDFDREKGFWPTESGEELLQRGASHLLLHLVNDGNTYSYNFADPRTLRKNIGPTSLTHALRLFRWAEMDPRDLIMRGGRDSRSERLHHLSSTHRNVALPKVLHDSATAGLADALHIGLDIVASREQIRTCGRDLLLCADVSCQMGGVELTEAFDDRLAFLRLSHYYPCTT